MKKSRIDCPYCIPSRKLTLSSAINHVTAKHPEKLSEWPAKFEELKKTAIVIETSPPIKPPEPHIPEDTKTIPKAELQEGPKEPEKLEQKPEAKLGGDEGMKPESFRPKKKGFLEEFNEWLAS